MLVAVPSVMTRADVDRSWNHTIVAGQTQIDTFHAWYTGDTSKQTLVIDGPWGSNTSC